jgi:1-acyl-sn-glycerol-3-phosphate acyltransferase
MDSLPPLAVAALVGFGLSITAFEVFALLVRGPEDGPFVTHARALSWIHARLFYGLRAVESRGDPIPAEGAFLVVANHQSGADPILLSLLTRRRIRFLMAREYYEAPILRYLFRRVGAIPVNRDGKDLGATKAALKALESGCCVGIFPQGGIRGAENPLDDSKHGVALLALRTAAPVIPFYIHGSPHASGRVFRAFFLPSRTTVFCGKPLRFTDVPRRKPPRTELEEVTRTILRAILDLRPQEAAERESAGVELRP